MLPPWHQPATQVALSTDDSNRSQIGAGTVILCDNQKINIHGCRSAGATQVKGIQETCICIAMSLHAPHLEFIAYQVVPMWLVT